MRSELTAEAYLRFRRSVEFHFFGFFTLKEFLRFSWKECYLRLCNQTMQSVLTIATLLLICCTSFGSALKCVLCYGGDVTPLCNDDQYSKHNFLQLSICSPPNSSHIPVCMKRKQIDATGAGPVEFRKCAFMQSDAALTCENRTEGDLTYRECYCNNEDGCNGSSYHTWSLSICTVSVLISCFILRKAVG